MRYGHQIINNRKEDVCGEETRAYSGHCNITHVNPDSRIWYLLSATESPFVCCCLVKLHRTLSAKTKFKRWKVSWPEIYCFINISNSNDIQVYINNLQLKEVVAYIGTHNCTHTTTPPTLSTNTHGPNRGQQIEGFTEIKWERKTKIWFGKDDYYDDNLHRVFHSSLRLLCLIIIFAPL